MAKNMKMNIVTTILFLLIIIGCDLLDNPEDETYLEGPAKVYNIEILGLTNNKIEFNVFAIVPTPCNYHSKTEKHRDKDDYYIKIFSRYDGEPCTGNLWTIEVYVSVITSSGEIDFHFWYSDTTSLDTTITIP